MTRMTRRQLVGRGATGAVALASAGIVAEGLLNRPPPRFDRDLFPRPSRSSVAVLRASSYDRGLEQIVAEGLRTVGADVRGLNVLLKPNLVEFRANSVINTDPRLVAATVVAMHRLGARKVVVAEGPGHRRDTEAIATASGLLEGLHETATRFIDLNAAPIAQTKLQTGYTPLRRMWLPTPV